MKRTAEATGRWSGITIGFLLFLMGLSEAGISFKEELMPKVYPELFRIEAKKPRLPLHDLYTRAQTYLGPQKKIANLYGAEEPDEAYLALYKDPQSRFPWMLTLNPYTGAVVGEMSMIKNFFAVLPFMHSNLFLGKAGPYLIGVLGLVLLFFVLSGIDIWLPYTHAGQKWKSTCTFDQQLQVLKNITPLMEENLISIHFCTQKNGLMKVSYGLRDRDFLNGYGRIIVDPLNGATVQEANSEKDPSSWNIKRLTIYPIHTGEYLGLFGRIVVFISGLAFMVIFCTGAILFFRRSRRIQAHHQLP